MTDLELLRQEAESRPDDVRALFEYAGECDRLGREAEALARYERVLAGIDSLPAGDRPRLYVQLGSTLRNLGRVAEAQRVLSEGARRFPHHAAVRVFLALAEYSSGDSNECVRVLLDVILRRPADASIERYAKSLRWYSENLERRDVR